jgi:rubrerythrin
MSFDFNADDILQLAIDIEKNGAVFYRASAAKIDDADAKTLLLSLADMEDEHEKTFRTLRRALSESEKASTVFDPEGEAALYLKALADTRVFFEKDIDSSILEDILKEAITAEKDSIVFYLGMKELVPEALGKERIDVIIKEEMSHIKILSKALVAARKE